MSRVLSLERVYVKLQLRERENCLAGIPTSHCGRLPNEAFMPHLEKIYPPEFVATLKKTMNEFKT